MSYRMANNIIQESASEWNSLLMTARAERGPQWDVGTQQYVGFSSITVHRHKHLVFHARVS